MAVSSVASSAVFLPSAEAADVIASVPAKPTVSSASPPVIKSVSAQTGPGTTSSDLQSRIIGINALIRNTENSNRSAGDSGITPEQIAQAQSPVAEHLQAGQGATIANADEQGLQGISFSLLPIDLPAPTSGSPSSSAFAAASQATAGRSTVAGAAPAAAPGSAALPSSTALPAVSSPGQASPQTSSLVASGETASSSSSTADIALRVLRPSDQHAGPDTGQAEATRQAYDIYA